MTVINFKFNGLKKCVGFSEIDPVDTPYFFSTSYHTGLQNHFNLNEDDFKVVSADMQISLHCNSPVTISYESTYSSQSLDGMQQMREKHLVLDLLNAVHRATNFLSYGDEDPFKIRYQLWVGKTYILIGMQGCCVSRLSYDLVHLVS